MLIKWAKLNMHPDKFNQVYLILEIQVLRKYDGKGKFVLLNLGLIPVELARIMFKQFAQLIAKKVSKRQSFSEEFSIYTIPYLEPVLSQAVERNYKYFYSKIFRKNDDCSPLIATNNC